MINKNLHTINRTFANVFKRSNNPEKILFTYITNYNPEDTRNSYIPNININQ